MQKLSGLVLDVYDDPTGEVLRGIFPTLADVPDLIKCASAVTPEQRATLPDDVFALVLHQGDVAIPKYACVDGGNTALSVEYFMKLGHRLPENAQRSTAQNLVTACGWYGIEPPEEMKKIALGLSTLMTAISVPSIAKGTSAQISQNLAASKAAGGAITPNALTFKPTA